MSTESFVSKMMEMTVRARLWHWSTDSAQHHVTYEQFLTQNEALTDSFVESSLGNDIAIDFSKVGVKEGVEPKYDPKSSAAAIRDYRDEVLGMQSQLEQDGGKPSSELISLLDDVVELCSKNLYLLKLK